MLGSSLSKVFGSSPFQLLQEHIKQVHQAVEGLPAFFDCVVNADWGKAEQAQQQIATAEHDADEMKKSIRQNLSNSLFMPVSRSDVLELLSMQDRVANTAKDVAGIVLGRQMQFFDPFKDGYLEYLQACIAVSKQAKEVVCTLDDLLEANFNESSLQEAQQKTDLLADLEYKTDCMQIKLRRVVFEREVSCEKPQEAVEIIFLYKLIELTGEIADYAEKVGDRLQILLAR